MSCRSDIDAKSGTKAHLAQSPQVSELVPRQRGWLEQLTVRSPRGRARATVQAIQARSMRRVLNEMATANVRSPRWHTG